LKIIIDKEAISILDDSPSKRIDTMNIKRKRKFAILMAIVGCLIANSSLRLDAVTLSAEEVVLIIGNETMFPTVDANNLLTDAISTRMTNVRGCLTEPFVYGIYGHTNRNNIVTGYSPKSDMLGFTLGMDYVWTFENEKYFRLGAAFGYVHGKTTPLKDLAMAIGGMAGNGGFEKDIHDVCAARFFGAYESFNDKCLKTNIGVILGYNYGRDRIRQGNDDSKFASHGLSLGLEFIKNLYAYDGYQFGLWLRANYSFISKKLLHDGDGSMKFLHNFLATVVGLNVEKEIFQNADKKTTLSLKTGWECRMQHIVSDETSNNSNETTGHKYPAKSVAIVSIGISQKLNSHWNIAGSYSARFGKDFLSHSLSGGIEYSF
jgi:hypothetical protein